MQSGNRVSIAGAGLVGTLLSIFLSRRGYKVSIFEKRPDPRTAAVQEGRSINLALSHRGIQALKAAGLEQEILKSAVPMKGRMIHPIVGGTLFQPYGEEDQCIYSVSRAGLNNYLLNAASKEENIHLEFSSKIKLQHQNDSYQLLQESDSGVPTSDFIISCDGAFSVVREALVQAGHCQAELEKLSHGYLELDIPAAYAGDLDPHALHIWPRQEFMLIALPNQDGSFTGTLFLPFEGPYSFSRLHNESEVQVFFRQWFPDTLDLLPDLAAQYFRQAPSFLATVHAFPWWHKNVLLLGDAAHAIVPFYGQGMNAGFEDVRIFNELLSTHSLEQAMPLLQTLRKPNADAIAELALQNFVEMRDLVDDPDFQLIKKVEARLHREYPAFVSQYALVTFTDTPYAVALDKGKKQWQVLQSILTIPRIHDTWNEKEVWEEIKSRILPSLQEIHA
ncbi:MAG: FAD-dependent monooxygenase [Cytophagaceae bacterium]|jgi:kynurenine 3-monooxygenase|nr:FAD-dependent monooxygenase [Cytophagaceae bacterium]